MLYAKVSDIDHSHARQKGSRDKPGHLPSSGTSIFVLRDMARLHQYAQMSLLGVHRRHQPGRKSNVFVVATIIYRALAAAYGAGRGLTGRSSVHAQVITADGLGGHLPPARRFRLPVSLTPIRYKFFGMPIYSGLPEDDRQSVSHFSGILPAHRHEFIDENAPRYNDVYVSRKISILEEDFRWRYFKRPR